MSHYNFKKITVVPGGKVISSFVSVDMKTFRTFCAKRLQRVFPCGRVYELHPLRSLVTAVPGHFGPKTDPWSLRSLVTSALRTELT